MNGLPRGARLRSGRNGRVPASPKVSCVGRRGRRAGQLARRTGGLHDRGEATSPCTVSRARVPFTGGCERGYGGARGGNRSDSQGIFALETRSKSNPQGSRRPSRGGTAPREGNALKGESQGRIGVGQPISKLGGVAPVEPGVRGNSHSRELARLKPPRGCESRSRAPQGELGRGTKPGGGTGRGRGNPRLPRSVQPIAAETGHLESTS